MFQKATKKPAAPAAALDVKIIPPNFIVLDANVFIADYWLRSPSFVLLRDFLRKANATLVIPKVVFEEVLNHHKEDLEKVKEGIRRELRNASRLVRNIKGQDGSVRAIIQRCVEDPYEKFLAAELEGLNARIPDYGDIPHALVVRRDLRRRKPFQESGKGYRDTLLWETIVRDCVQKEATAVFITQNTRDFCDPTGGLHKDLELDVLAKKTANARVVLCKDLPTFTDTYIVPYMRKRRDFAVLVQNDKVPGLNLKDVCEQNNDALVEALNKSPSVMIGNPGVYEPEVDGVETPTEVRVVEASEVSGSLLLVVFEFHADVAFIYFLPHSEYFAMSDDESSKIAVLDAEWNEYVMRVETVTTVVFRCRLTFNSNAREVESFEVEGVESPDE